MRQLRWLTALPVLGILLGPFAFNRVEPFVLGMPMLLGWLVLCVLATSAVMALIYFTDPQNREHGDGR